ncbi:zinc-dependent alcohol dehydrogenase family protein [Streptomyces iconiensis]|uniref:Zinc-dependent alcohol dehydrogenase family protein n=1 Tax=Streptomyces iconiensis TaxID=1384038 RepID=A0ABT6ZNQ8_9ACTN|nr:zinc-dependent alcohol dehydrogenase family protein [Streptomyces iconiensis]MDJ1130690.1 zinc-dependent alcohol dehydrogenase family protein [Streptomyces iconiensis]
MAKAVLFHELGGPEVLRLVDVPLGEPGDGQVRVRVDALGLNRAEAMFRRGQYYYQPALPSSRIGCEAAGVVEAVGAGVDGLTAGDPVSIFPGPFSMSVNGVYGDTAIVPARAVIRRQDFLDTIAGASVWTAFMTAYGPLIEVGKIRPGDPVLITAASSSVGIAAIQIANHLGAVPIATTRTSAKKDQLLALGAAHVLAMDEGDLAKRVHALTEGRGVKVAFDAVAGADVSETARTVAPGGVLIIYGWLDQRPTPLPLMPLNIHVYGHVLVTGDDACLRRAEAFINAGLRSGSFTPVVDRVFELADIVEAHRYLESNTQVGKIVATVPH